MKKHILSTVITVLFLAMAFFTLGCNAEQVNIGSPDSTSSSNSNNSTSPQASPQETPSLPALMPASHENRFEEKGANACYGCHGAGDLANPMLNGAAIIPANHYVEGSYETKQLAPERAQCNTCHALATEEA